MAVINKDYANIKKGTTDLQRLYAGNTLIWELETPQPTPTGYSNEYLTFIAKGNGNNRFSFSGSSWVQGGNTFSNKISYSLDSGVTWSEPSSSVNINVNSGDTVMWKGEMTPDSNHSNGIGTFSNSNTFFDIQGNVMSLLYGDNFANQTDLTNLSYAFNGLFSMSWVISAENLILPATILSSRCYQGMFQSCSYLTTPPQLPATTLASICYSSMFSGCRSLTTAPQLQATTLANNCCREMFYGCTSLTTPPSLPATALTNNCYEGMFQGCTSLTTAPELPATTLANSCYYCMFRDCTSLNYIKMLATDISASGCLYFWVDGVAATGTFVKAASMTSLPTGFNGIPTSWTVQNE